LTKSQPSPREAAITRLLLESYQRGITEAIDAEILARHAIRETHPAE
jgi:hypothetical protein